MPRSPATPNLTHLTPPDKEKCNCWKNLPWKSHPIFQLRRVNITISLIGLFLCWLVWADDFEGYGRHLMLSSSSNLCSSAVFCFADLFCYALKKAKTTTTTTERDAAAAADPKWPKLLWMIGDVLLCIYLQYVFWAELSWMYGGVSHIFNAWILLAELLCSLFHFYAFWKQLMACYEKKWLANQQKHACARCGFSESSASLSRQHANEEHHNTFTYPRPSATHQYQPDILTPESNDQALEEGLLSVAGWNGGYQSIAEPESTVDQPDEVVAGSKGKKKASSSSASRSAQFRRMLNGEVPVN